MKNRLLYAIAFALALPMAAQAALSISVNIAPPPLPVYVQPEIPVAGYLWTPGYWRWDPRGADYFWVPGTWVSPPAVGLLWTPGYWGWGGGGYLWHGGYWGPHVGFYGGVNYGHGYDGSGYHGGYWRGGVFNYNRSVNHIDERVVRHVYNERIVENNHTRVSFNGGQGGIAARESAEERAAHGEHHLSPTSMQHQHEQTAMRSPEQRAAFNHGAPTMAAMPRPSMARNEGPHGQAMREGREGPQGRVEGQRMERHDPGREMREAPQHMERGGPARENREAPQHADRAAPAQHAERGAPAREAEPRGEHHGGGNGGNRER